MKTPLFRATRPIWGALAALVIVPALPLKAEGPIDHLQKRRAQIHSKVGDFFARLGRKIEDASDHVEYRTAPPPPPVYRREPRPYDDEERMEFELRYGRGPGHTFPDGTPYPDEPAYREDWRYREEPRVAPNRPRGPERYSYEEDELEPGIRDPYRDQGYSRTNPPPTYAPRREEAPKKVQPAPEKHPTPAPMPESKASTAPSGPKTFDDGGTLKYGRPVPGRQGFVYPPGVKEEAKNMIDVRDFQPGQKVKDPRTGDVFLVP
ncbi:MAG: hypothetical protein ACAI34_16670 [Verrucomicrobium sp.]